MRWQGKKARQMYSGGRKHTGGPISRFHDATAILGGTWGRLHFNRRKGRPAPKSVAMSTCGVDRNEGFPEGNSLLKEWTTPNGQKVCLVWTDTKGNRNNILRFIIEDLRGNKVSFTPTYDQITALLLGLEMEEKMKGKVDNVRDHWRYIVSLAISVLARNEKEYYQAEDAIDEILNNKV